MLPTRDTSELKTETVSKRMEKDISYKNYKNV